jgi:hypothetical protein
MEWFEEDQVCNKLALESYTNLDPKFGARVAGWVAEATDIFNDAMAKTPSYGSINARIKHLRERQKQDVQNWIKVETKRRQVEMQPATDAFFTSALTFALQALVLRQGIIIQTQSMYAKRVPTYRPVNLTKLVCSFQGKKFACREDVGQAGIRVQDVLNGIDEIQQQINRPTSDSQ